MLVLAVLRTVMLCATVVNVNAQSASTDSQCPTGTVSVEPPKTCTTGSRRSDHGSHGSNSEHSECGRWSFCYKEGPGAGICCRRSRGEKPTAGDVLSGPQPTDGSCPGGSVSVVPEKTCTRSNGSESKHRECGRMGFCYNNAGPGAGVCCQRTRSTYKCPTVDPSITCDQKSDNCTTGSDCGKRSKCCPGPCGLVCSEGKHPKESTSKEHPPPPPPQGKHSQEYGHNSQGTHSQETHSQGKHSHGTHEKKKTVVSVP